MPTEIDSLQISINAKAQTANRQIDALVGRLDILQKSLGRLNSGSSNLVGVANGVDRLGKAMQTMNTVKTADFTRLASNLAKLGTINVSALNSTASSLSHLTRAFNNIGAVSSSAVQVGELARNLAKLGYKSVDKAIVNLPLLATGIKNLMTTLSTAPKVSDNLIRMTNAISNLAAQGSRVGTASRSMSTNLGLVTTSTARASLGFKGLTSAIGMFYARYFLVLRGIKLLYKAIDSTADYIEAYNYLDVALGKIGSDWEEQWSEYAKDAGVSSAEEYANSFSSRLKEKLKGLSGLEILETEGGNGLLSDTGLKNLGLNIQEVTQYASQLASVTNSIGQTGEVSLATASAFTKLGADISSLFNLDYSDVMKNLQSGLIGQSRSLYKYGIDITNATLQTLAYELGLEKSVSEMSQMEKQQLRIIQILRASKVSWGDLANTINSPSNMMRQFKNNAKELGMVFGQLLMPALTNIMPFINGLTIALKKLLVTFASVLGVELNLSEYGQGYSELGEDAEDVADGFNSATNAIKKFKGQLLGIDELNVLNSGNDAGGAGGFAMNTIDLSKEILKATEEYEKAWEEAYRRMQNKAQSIAEKIDKILAPIKGVFANIFSGNYYAAGYGFGEIFANIFNWLSEEIDKVDWQQVGENIGKFIAGINWSNVFKSIGNLAGTILESIFDAWNGSFKSAPFETALISIFGALSFSGVAGTIVGKLATALSTTLGSSTIGVIPTIAISAVTWVIGFNVGKSIGKALFPDDVNWYDDFTFDGFFEEITKSYESTMGGLALTIAKVNPTTLIADLFTDGRFSTTVEEYMLKAISNNFSDKPILEKLNERNKIEVDFFKYMIDESKKQGGALGLSFYLIEELGVALKPLKKTIEKWFEEDVKPWFTEEKWSGIFSGIGNAFENIWDGITKVFKEKWNMFADWLNEKLTIKIDTSNLIGLGISTLLGSDKIRLVDIPKFKHGGFPEDGLFMANHNELVGQFSNGRTAVANNEQIISGIEGGVERAVSRVLAPYLADIADSSRRTANKEFGISRKQAFNAVREEAKIFRQTTGSPAF